MDLTLFAQFSIAYWVDDSLERGVTLLLIALNAVTLLVFFGVFVAKAAEAWGSGATWNDAECGGARAYICEQCSGAMAPCNPTRYDYYGASKSMQEAQDECVRLGGKDRCCCMIVQHGQDCTACLVAASTACACLGADICSSNRAQNRAHR